MNLLRRCGRARIASSLSLSSHPSRRFIYLRPLIPFLPYSIGATNSQDHSSFATWSHEANKKQPFADSPRPQEIPYQAKVANLVNLIGHIKLPVKFQSFPDGKHYAATLISQENGTVNSCWIPVLFEGDLAHVVSCHVKENDCVYVTGKLSMDPLPFAVHQKQGDVHILAVDINFVEGFDEKAHVYSYKKNSQITGSKRSAQNPKDVGSWKDLMQNPSQFVNFTGNKSKGLVSQRHPDFKHRESGVSLWLDRAPHWFLESFKNSEDVDTTVKKEGVGKCIKEEMWKSLDENPEEWWDNRLDKKNIKYADFKHKKTGEGLWIGKSPEWFVPKDVTIVKGKKNESWVEDPNQWWDNMSDKKNEESTDSKPKETGEGLWLDRSPDCVGKDSKEELWKSLAENPEQWWDNRLDKKNIKFPDFKHKKTNKGLWLNSSPEWFVPKDLTIVKDRKDESWVKEDLNKWLDNMSDKKNEESTDSKPKETGEGIWLDSPYCVGKDSKEKLWKSLAENPEQWCDNRLKKRTEKAPDFKHKETGEALWIGDSPGWFVPKDVTIVKDKKNESWKSLVENPNQWWDNRLYKKNKKAPDFKHKETGEALWLSSSPHWAVSKLPPLKQNEHVGGV